MITRLGLNITDDCIVWIRLTYFVYMNRLAAIPVTSACLFGTENERMSN